MVLGPNNIINTGSKLRLQLYKSHNSQKKKASQLEVFLWWSTKSRTLLPASLYISFEQCNMLSMEPALRSMLPLQEETGKPTRVEGSGICNESTHLNLDDTHSILENKKADVKWLRNEGEPFEIPEQLSLSLESTVSCQNLKFSSLGRILVAGCGSLGQHFLLFYEIPSGKMLHKIIAHSDVIYDLDWSENDECLLSASADYCVKLWNTNSWNLSSTFIHPSFVYSAKFQPALKNILVTGCYDHVIRIWTYNKTVQLLQELEGHNAAVNTLCWFRKNMKLFSADDAGDIKMWKIPSRQKTAKRGFEKYVLDKELSFQEIKGISVNKIVTSNSEDVLFLFCGDSSVWLVDPSVESNFTCYESVQKTAVSGCCSPCGNLLFLYNDDDERVLVWRRKFYKQLDNEELGTFRNNLKEVSFNAEASSGIFMENKIEETSKTVNLHSESSSITPQKDRNELKNSLNFKEKNRFSSKKNISKSYMYDADTSVEEDLAKLAFNALIIKRNSSNNVGEMRYGNSIDYHEGSGNSESVSKN
ncbi:hypothetical protein TNIN_273021 [Trichonephila inaurata madagascariensis]|uniref:Uncharacterized protein n=1 Tax=Trichonephila inaurata madagascariensis TaxID=2747483 RepID=A0A8X6Y3V1_9ARAC|nr:hypothetical protein TNIN_273021 [Trichonephila inaurata madagascariensis]